MKGDVKEIYKVYDGKHRELVVPVYQRNYDWSTKQCARLFNDLEDLVFTKRPKHFFGAVVGNAEGTWRWVIIDGQQRLTTVSLLILALTHSIRDGKSVTDDPELGTRISGDYLFIGDAGTEKKFKLKPVKNDSLAYERLFRPESEFIETSNVTVNYRYFLKRLEHTALTADQVWDAISRLEVMHLDLEPHDDPQRIFETLNSTGLALSEADKIRNLVLMGLDHNEQTWLYENRWNSIEHNVSFRTDWYIRWYLVTKTTRTPKESEVFEAFKSYLKKVRLPVAEVLDDMHTYSKYALQITTATTGFPAVDKRLKRINLILGDVALPFLLPVLHDAHEKTITADDLVKVLVILESYIFRRFVCGIPTNALNKIFATAYNELRKLRISEQRYSDLFAYILLRREGASGRFPDDTEFQEAFETRNFYSIQAVYSRYLFESLENGNSLDVRDIATGLENGAFTVEHIMPRTLSQTWRNELGPDAEEIHSTWVNRIANLTVTGYNSSYSNSPFEKKKTMQNGFLESPFRLNSHIKQQETWGLEALQERGRQLTESALKYWPYPKTSFEPPKVVLPTEPMGADTNFTGRVLISYEYGDVKETVESWADLLPKVIRHLLTENRESVLRFTSEEDSFLRTADVLSVAEREKHRQVDHGLYVWASTSTNAKVTFLRKLFGYLDIDPEELVFTLRPIHKDEPAEVEVDEPVSPFTALTKYLDEFREASDIKATTDDTAELRERFLKDLEPFERPNPAQDLGGKSIEEFKAETPLAETSAEQILAIITQMKVLSAIMGSGAFHTLVSSGDLSAYLGRLKEL